jgi:hypothetical protein
MELILAKLILAFVDAVAVRMLDPLSLAAAAAFGIWAGTRPDSERRWLVIALGTVALVAALATLSTSLGGMPMSFWWAQATAVSFLQIWLISLATRKWRATRNPAPKVGAGLEPINHTQGRGHIGRTTKAPRPRIERILIFYQGPKLNAEDINRIAGEFENRFDLDTEGAVLFTYDVTRMAAENIKDFAFAKVAELEGRELTAGALKRTVIHPVDGLGAVALVYRDAIPAPGVAAGPEPIIPTHIGGRTNAARARIERIFVLHQGPKPTPDEIHGIVSMFEDRFDVDTKASVHLSTWDVTGHAAENIEDLALAKVAALEGRELTAGALKRTVTYRVPGQGVVAVVWRDAIPALKQRKA